MKERVKSISHWKPNYYIVMDLNSGEYFPLPHSGWRGRGGSFTEPTKWKGTKETIPRLFHSEWAAQCFINAWMKGHWGSDNQSGDASMAPERQKRRFTIINVELTNVHPY